MKRRTLVTVVVIVSLVSATLGSCGLLGIFPQTFSLDVSSDWFASGVDVTSGDELRISAEGSFTINPDYQAITADGADEFGTPLEFDAANGTDDASTYPMPDGTMGALVGKIGSGGEVFEIGSEALIPAATTGELYVVINDNMMDNNEGILDVEVRGTGLLSR